MSQFEGGAGFIGWWSRAVLGLDWGARCGHGCQWGRVGPLAGRRNKTWCSCFIIITGRFLYRFPLRLTAWGHICLGRSVGCWVKKIFTSRSKDWMVSLGPGFLGWIGAGVPLGAFPA